MAKNVSLEFKKVNEDFSLFKLKNKNEKVGTYGFCFNSEIEDFKNGIFPKEGFQYHYTCKKETDRDIEDKDYNCILREEKYQFLFIEEVFLFEDFEHFFNNTTEGYYIKVDENGIATEYYDKLKFHLPLEIKGMLDTDVYSPVFIKHLTTVKENFIVSYYEKKGKTDLIDDELEDIEETENLSYLRNRFEDWLNSDEENFEDEDCLDSFSDNWNDFGNGFEENSNPYANSIVDFVWFPTKQEWDIFYKKYQETDYDTAIEFLINDILKIAKNDEQPLINHFDKDLILEEIVKTLKINDVISFYKHVLIIENQPFYTYDICLTKELERLEEDLVLPKTITCKKQESDCWSRILIARKEYLNLIKINENYLYDENKRQEFMYSPEYFMNSVKNIDFDEFVFIQETFKEGHFSYMNYLTGYPLITSIAFDEDNGNPINKNGYDLENIKHILKDREDIVFKKQESIIDTLYAYSEEKREYNCLNFIWYPTEKDWKKLCDEYLLESSYFDCLPGHFYNMKILLKYIADEILKLPTKEEN